MFPSIAGFLLSNAVQSTAYAVTRRSIAHIPFAELLAAVRDCDAKAG